MILAASGLINPEAWWARYVPQIWLAFSGLALALVIEPSCTRVSKSVGSVALCVMALNSVGIGIVAGTSFLARDDVWKTVLTSLAGESQKEPIKVYLADHGVVKTRLDSFGIRYTLVDNGNDCNDGAPLIPQPNKDLTTVLLCK